MTGLLAMVLAAVAVGLLTSGRPDPLRSRLAPTGSKSGRGDVVEGVPTRAVGRGISESHRSWRRLSAVGRRRGEPAQRETEIAEACLALAAELHTGAPVPRALAVVADDWPDLLRPAAGRAAVGGDIAVALRETADRPGAASLRAVAAGWEVTARTGAPLSRVVVAVADALRAEAAVRREAHSQLATAKATARLLAILPFGTLLLLSGNDRTAIGFLVSSPYGWACLAGAVAFVSIGLWWVNRLARFATRSAWDG